MCDDGGVREIVIHPPWAGRIFAVLFAGGFALTIAISFAVALARGADISGAPFGIGMAVVAGTLGYRLATLSFRARGEELVIHNYWRTRHIPISRVHGLDLGKATAGNLRTVRIQTMGGAVPIDVLGISRRASGRRVEGLNRQLEELAEWIAAARSLSGMAGLGPGEDSAIGRAG